MILQLISPRGEISFRFSRRGKKDHFSMECYEMGLGECGTVRCVAGWAYHLFNTSRLYDAWLFGTNLEQSSSAEWQWCFSEIWNVYDDTVEGAVHRIKMMLNDEIPHNWRWQMKAKKRIQYLQNQNA